MSLRIRDSLRNGFDRATNRNAGHLFVVFFFVTLMSTIVTNSAVTMVSNRLRELFREMSAEPLPSEAMVAPSPPIAIPMSLELTLVLVGILWIAGETARVISDRTFISEETEQLYEPTRWIGWATLSSFAYVVIFNFLLLLYVFSISFFGVLAPVLGLFWTLVGGIVMIVVSLLLFFTRQEIATRDVGPIEAMTGSWSLVRTNEIELFGLGVILTLIDIAHQIVSFSIGSVSQRLMIVVSPLLSAAVLVFFSAVVAQAYRQLRSEARRDKSETTEWPLDPNDEWNDPPL